ncbi:MAG: response regulator transcription factor [Methanomicrobiales archaeon]|nr:response regulator transcription factor [Methanomicrobiales archaeon]
MSPSILIVEDDQPILEMMDLMIRRLGYDPVLATNGIDALELIKTETPALILLDIMMMPINGWEFLERLRALPGRKDIPVLFFTATPEVEERMAQLHDPNLGVLHKPVTFSELKAGIEAFLRAGPRATSGER